MNNRKMIKEKIIELDENFFVGNLRQTIKDLEKYANQPYENVYIELKNYYDGPSEFIVLGERMETEEECNKRILNEKKVLEKNIEQEEKRMEKLRKQYYNAQKRIATLKFKKENNE